MNQESPSNREAAVQRARVKVFVEKGADIPLHEFIFVFHRWIREGRVPGVLVDVAEYTHVHEGPGVLLIAHEWDYSIDEVGGRRGFLVNRKRAGVCSAREALYETFAAAAFGAHLLEQEVEFSGRLRFSPWRWEVAFADRLHAPNEPDVRKALEAFLRKTLEPFFPDLKIIPEEDRRSLVGFRLEAGGAADLKTLSDRFHAELSSSIRN